MYDVLINFIHVRRDPDEDKTAKGQIGLRCTLTGALSGAAHAADRLSVTLGTFLKSSSVLRILLVFYIVFLHFVALVILYFKEAKAVEELEPLHG
jgi:hypothetical protein